MDIKPKILYVDDEPINLKLFEINFAKRYNIKTALDGIEGLEILNKENDISTIISDMKMPEMDGVDFIKKAKEKFPNKKYVILTGFEIIPGTNPKIDSAIENGLISKCLRKPFKNIEIEEVIE
jgi:two-component system response regulator (stage 0 sporulation protein F)